MDDATGLAEALLGLDGFRVLECARPPTRWASRSRRRPTWWDARAAGCGRWPRSAERVDIRDLPCFGRPARLVWMKRRWRCADPDCEQKTWTEGSPHVPVSGRAHRAGRVPRPRARSVSSPCPSPSWPESSGCAGGRSWTPSCTTAPRSSMTPLGWAPCGRSASTRPRSSRRRGSTTRSTRRAWSISTPGGHRHDRGQQCR